MYFFSMWCNRRKSGTGGNEGGHINMVEKRRKKKKLLQMVQVMVLEQEVQGH